MKKLLLTVFVAILSLGSAINAENVISTSASTADEIVIDIMNEEKMNMIAFDLLLPTGSSLIYDDDIEDYDYTWGKRMKTGWSMTIDPIEGGYHFIIYSITKDLAVYSGTNETILSLEADVQGNGFVQIANTKVADLDLKLKAVTEGILFGTMTLELNPTGYSSYCACANVNVSGATVMGAKLNGNTLTLAGDGTTVPANTGVILKGEPGATVTLTAAETADAIDSDLTPSVLTTAVEANSVLTLSKTEEAFYTFSGTEIPANKAYLKMSTSAGGRIRVVENTTGIKNINAEDITLNYNLMGQPIKTQKGIIIENGVKTIKF